jgi:hypothetical protein
LPQKFHRVFLTDEEYRVAVAEAVRRQTENEQVGRPGRNGGPEVGQVALHYNILGAIGELAVAKYLSVKENVFSDKVPNRNSEDLPGNIDVKTTDKHAGRLIVQHDADPEKIFVLVTVTDNRTAWIQGWSYGHEAMRGRYWDSPVRGRPAFFVPQKNLREVSQLKRLVNSGDY